MTLQKLTPIKSRSVWLPNFVAPSVLAIEAGPLTALGITKLVFDIDETLVPRKGMQLTEPYFDHINGLRKAGFDLYIGSNATRDLTELAASIEATIVTPTSRSFKPLSSYYRLIAAATKAPASQIAMIGDRPLNDIIGPNRAGFTTILVDAVTRRPKWAHRHYINWVLAHAS